MILNIPAFDHAKALIESGNITMDAHWTAPTPEAENIYIENHGMQAYARWFLGVRPDSDPTTKGAYAFPFSNDFENVNLEGIRAIDSRAGEYHYADIEAAGETLKSMAADASY